MDINVLRGIATIVVMVTFLSIFWWAYIYKSKDSFDEAANLPFADEAEDAIGTKMAETNIEGENP